MLTKDEIEKLMPEPAAPAKDSGYVSIYEPLPATPDYYTAQQVRAVVNDAIAEHTRKVLEGVEPVAWGNLIAGFADDDRVIFTDKASAERYHLHCYPLAPLCPATTVAALKSERDALQARVDAVEKDAARLDWLDSTNARFRMGWSVGRAPAGNVSITSVIFLGKPVIGIRDAIDAALAAKGQA